MSFEVDQYSSAWAHIALCADLTWATEPPDEFIIANQRLWAQHCRVSQVLQDATESHNPTSNNQCELTEKRSSTNQIEENGSCSGRRSVKDVIPESRLAQHYGNFYYDEVREKCYTNANDKSNGRGYSGQGCENSDLTECWMLPEVEYWFRKLVDEPSDRSLFPRRRRQYRMLADDDFERWGLAGAAHADEEAALAARVLAVRPLWAAPPRAPSPPPAPRKIRARRRQPRRLQLAPPPPAYCLDAPRQLFCDPTNKFQWDAPRAPALAECQRAMGRLSASVQAVMRASAARCPPYRGTNVSRYAPHHPIRAPRAERRYVWWPRDPAPPPPDPAPCSTPPDAPASPHAKEKPAEPVPSTSAAAAPMDPASRKKRLYSTVLSMSAPAPLNLTPVGCVRLSQKLVTPGLLKLSPKLVLPTTRLRAPNVDNKFEELEKEALEQYKASDESIDTKFSELEKQAVEQYSASNSNTSCSSGTPASPPAPPASPDPPEDPDTKKQPAKFHKDKAVDSVVIYSQNFPDVNTKGQTTTSVTNLKNFHTPPRGEKKEQTHRSNKSLRSLKSDPQRAASDTDYDSRESKGHKGPLRWTLHVVPSKKRHLTLCVSDCSSDEDAEGGGGVDGGAMRDAPRGAGPAAAHGAGDLQLVRKSGG